jgi:hypothetical protein
VTPSQILAIVRDFALAAGIGVIAWLIYRGGKDHAAADAMKALQAQITVQARTLDTWHQESAHANEKLSADMAKINAAAAAPSKPVWVCPPEGRERSVLPTPTSEAGGEHPVGGAALEGSGPDHARNIGPELSAFKQRWETVLAECRALDAQWPK